MTLRCARAQVLARVLRRRSGAQDLVEKQFASPGSDGHEEIAEVFRARTRAEWTAFNDEHDC